MITEVDLIDRLAKGWPSGPWDGEPDRTVWTDEVTGLTCRANRNNISGAWCGYVCMPHGHVLHGVSYEQMPAFDVHGGVTFADHRIDGLWWIGFDCRHWGDYSPQDAKNAAERGGCFELGQYDRYRTIDYVRQQCALLALQIAKFSNDGAVK